MRPRAVLMAVFIAAASAACGDARQPPRAGSTMADTADQVMYGASFNMTERGVIRAAVEADTAYFFDDNTRVEFDRVKSTFYTGTGMKDAVLTSDHGRYHTRQGDMTAFGDVLVVSEDGRRLSTPELHYSQGRNEFFSDSQFTLREGGGRVLSGIGFRSDPNLNNVRVLRGASGFLPGATLPGSPGGSGPTTEPSQPRPIPPPPSDTGFVPPPPPA